MKKVLTIYMLIAAMCFSNLLMAQHEEGKGHAHATTLNSLGSKKNNLRAAATTVGLEYDLKYCRMSVQVDPNVVGIQGTITSQFIVKKDSLRSINFELASNMIVDSVSYHGSNTSFQHSNEILSISLPLALILNDLDSISVSYHGAPISTGNGSFEVQKHLQDPVLWTLSEPLGASDWWPCKQIPGDKIDSIDIYITAPSQYTSVSNGVLVDEKNSNGYKTAHWQSHYPIAPYLICLAVSNYIMAKDYLILATGDTLQLVNYIYPEDSAYLPQLSLIKEIIGLFDSLTIPYPFAKEKYGHCQFSWNGGMEHQTISFVSIFDYSLLAHECAHQWFGDQVTCGSWHDIWLNEGFATYFEALTKEFKGNNGSFNDWKKSTKSTITSVPDGSVYCPDTTNSGRIFSSRLSYNKGAFVLHMLRYKLGDSIFFSSIKNYLNDTALRYHYAKTNDLKKHFENTSGLNLTSFFNKWVYGEGYPTYQAACNYHWGDFKIVLKQTTSHNSVMFYDMPVEVRLQASGHDTIIKLDNNFSGQVYNLKLNFRPVLITIDPNNWLLTGQNTVSYLVSGVEDISEQQPFTLYPNPAADLLNLSGIPVDAAFNIRISNSVGAHIKSIKNCSTANTSIDIHDLVKGMYIVSIEGANEIYTTKFIKE